MNNKRILLSSPHMGGLEKEFINEAFRTNWIAPLGENVDKFEEEISQYVGVKSAAATVTGTSSIHMALKCIGVKRYDIVFCSSLTFAASCNPIIYEGGIPVFIDSEEETWNMCPKSLEKAFIKYSNKGKLPKAVIVVDLYGESAKYDEIREICNRYKVPIIEDSAEALGSTYKGRKLGSLGDYGVISFNGNKIITTSGGGMLLSNNKKMIDKTKFWITQAREKERYYEHKELGYNYRMSNVLAGIGRGQLRVLGERVKKKREIHDFYKNSFENMKDIQMKPQCEFSNSNEWLSCMLINKESNVKPIDVILALEKENIESRNIWKPMHMQPYYKGYDFISIRDKSVAEDIFDRGVCLPSDTKNSKDDMERVINTIKSIIYA